MSVIAVIHLKLYIQTAWCHCNFCLTFTSHSYAGSSSLMLRLFSVSRVDAVSVLGTLSRDKAAVPHDWRARDWFTGGRDVRQPAGRSRLSLHED